MSPPARLGDGAVSGGITTRLTWPSMLDEIRQEDVDTARSIGLPERRVSYKYPLRNALMPTVAGRQFARLRGGTMVIEAIFSWPGVSSGLAGDADLLWRAGLVRVSLTRRPPRQRCCRYRITESIREAMRPL